MTIATGTRLGPYEIVSKLGEGGMGVVYRARDSQLGREVAVKVLPEGLTADAERLARFEREAKLLAQLNHPNIAQVYGLETSGPERALVMELVEGTDLSALMAGGPLPLEESLAIARQIAEALEAAHERGIVHRDLKPQNVKVANGGRVKVLDFGLAKAMDPATGSSSTADLARSPTLMNSPTLTGMHGTQLGVILGSAAYMAPEQAKGMAVDKRADIWAFGVVLYEMLTGGSLFAGDSVGDTLAAVIRAEIDLGRLPAETPGAVRQLLRRCLERNPKNRLHDIADARIMLDEVLSAPPEPAATTTAAATSGSRPWLGYLVGAVGLAIGLTAIALPWLRGSKGAPAPASLRLEIAAPEDTTLLSGLAISPDGTTLAFVARGVEGRSELWVRRLDSLEARALPGTAEARFPFWSPDGRRIGFFAEARLKVTDLVGTPRILATTAATPDARGGSWGADDTILYAPSFVGGLKRVSARGGEAVSALEIPAGSDLGTLRFPHFLPDGRRFVVYGSGGSGNEPGQLLLGELGSPAVKPLTESNSMAVFAAPDRLLYVRGESLVAHRFDLAAGALVGEAELLGLRLPGGFAVSSQRSLSVSSHGILVARQDKRGVTHPLWVDRQGKELEEISGGGQVWWYAPRISPDGRRLAISRYETGGSGDVWIHDFERGMASRFTFSDGDDQIAVWSADGRSLAYSSSRAGRPMAILLAAADQPGQERLWYESTGFLIPSAFTPDGRELVFERGDENGMPALWIGLVEGAAAPRLLFPDPGGEWAGDLSPDGRYIAYASDLTRRSEVYVRKLDGTDNPLRVSTEGGGQPRWRRDGRELFYVDESGRLVALAVEPGEPPRFSAPAKLFDARHEDSPDRQYDVALDGQRFFLNRRAGGDREPILVLIGWDRKSQGDPEPQP